MTDKAREMARKEFEIAAAAITGEEFDWPFNNETGEYRAGFVQRWYALWLAAKEKYEPKGCAWTYEDDTESYATQCGGSTAGEMWGHISGESNEQ